MGFCGPRFWRGDSDQVGGRSCAGTGQSEATGNLTLLVGRLAGGDSDQGGGRLRQRVVC